MNDESTLNDAIARLSTAQQTASSSVGSDRQELTITDVVTSWLRFFWNWRKTFMRTFIFFLLIGAVAAFVIPASYTARATILPPENSSGGLSGLLAALPMAATQLLGSSSGDSKMIELYVDIAKSQTVLTEVLNAPYNGATFRDALRSSPDVPDWKIIERLRANFAGSKHPRTQLVMFELTRHDPELAAAILNQMLKEMDRFFRYRMATTENMQRKMIEKRIGEVSDSLHLSEEQLRQFKEGNRSTFLSPTLTLEEGRLMREVEINDALYIELTKQLELAKINETESMPVLNVLDYASPPEKRSGPSIVMMLLSSLAVGFCLTFAFLRLRTKLPRRLSIIGNRLLRIQAPITYE